MIGRRAYRTMIASVLGAGLLLAAATGVFADHSWNSNHWRSDNLAPTVVNRTTSSLYNVPAAATEWSNLGTPIQPTLTTAKKGNITVSEASNVFWLGLARIFIDGSGHITKGEVKLNTRLLRAYGPAAADHVLCQELGHVLGLDHNRTQLDTCMNDQAPLGSATSPNAHDTEQLNLIYNHSDTTGTTSSSSSTGAAPSGNGVWITVHVFPAP
jgi:hypothetical protein